MKITVAQIAERLGGELQGDGDAVITGMAGLRDAGPADISFLASPKYTAAVAETAAGAVIVDGTWQGACKGAVIRVAQPDAAFARVPGLLGWEPHRPPAGVHATAVCADDVTFGAGVCIGPHCVLESGVKLGDRTVLRAACFVGAGSVVGNDCVLHARACVAERCRLGHRVVLQCGAVVGSDGFGYVREGDAWRKVPQVGTVEIGDDVEIGANAAIDRARFGKTLIGDGVKIDNLVQVAHNVHIGAHTAIAAQVGISGSTTVGQGTMLGGQAGVAGHLALGDGAVVGAQAGVTKDVPPATFVSGYPAMPHGKARRMHAHVMRLPDLKQKVAELEKRVRELEGGTPTA